jgi:hypothetical protein
MDRVMAQPAANRRTSTNERTPDEAAPDEAKLWRRHLELLRQALRLRKPDARGRVRSEAARLEREIAALSGRRELLRRRLRWSDGATGAGSGESAVVQLDGQIAQRLRQVSDLAALLRDGIPPAAAEDAGATAEAALRGAAADPVAMLVGKGKLTEDQARAAHEIAWVHQAITKASRARVSRFSQIDPPAGWQEMPLPERAALVHAKRFLPWAEALRREQPQTLDIVLKVAVLGLSIYAVARHHRMGWKTCVTSLAEGLDRYWRAAGRHRTDMR